MIFYNVRMKNYASKPKPAAEYISPDGQVFRSMVKVREFLAEVVCHVCGTGDEEEGSNEILLCDGCEHAYHMRCLPHPLAGVPEGHWRCPACCPLSQGDAQGACCPLSKRRRCASPLEDETSCETLLCSTNPTQSSRPEMLHDIETETAALLTSAPPEAGREKPPVQEEEKAAEKDETVPSLARETVEEEEPVPHSTTSAPREEELPATPELATTSYQPGCALWGCNGVGQLTTGSDVQYTLACDTCGVRWQSSWWWKQLHGAAAPAAE